MARVIDARDEAAPRRPVLIKIAPDLDLRALDDVVAVCAARGVDGMIVSNTTIARPPSLARRHMRARPAVCRAGRYSSRRRECWRGRFCAAGARFR